MVLNTDKTKIISFSYARDYQAVPFVAVKDGDPILCVDKIKLLGLVFDDKLTWWPFVSSIKRNCGHCYV